MDDILKLLAAGFTGLIIAALKPLLAPAKNGGLGDVMRHNIQVEGQLLRQLKECERERDDLRARIVD